MSESNLPNPFETAKRVSGVSVRLRPEDLTHAMPGVGMEIVERLLNRHGGTLAAVMLSAGIEAAIEIIHQEGGGA
ncbi:MAG: hypothetical protein H0X11_11700 [Betaproteobacteria bacterium]|nr:hypothetical protein [Betaproteobacteria bacterium]